MVMCCIYYTSTSVVDYVSSASVLCTYCYVLGVELLEQHSVMLCYAIGTVCFIRDMIMLYIFSPLF